MLAKIKATVTSGTNDFLPPEAFPSIYTQEKRDFSYYTDSFFFGCRVNILYEFIVHKMHVLCTTHIICIRV